MIPNENARATCRDCHCLVIPVLRPVKQGMNLSGKFTVTDDSKLITVCPLCESPKLNRHEDVSELQTFDRFYHLNEV